MSRITSKRVVTRRLIVPGNFTKFGVIPNGITGNTGILSGAAASTAIRSAKIKSVQTDKYECCSTEPIGMQHLGSVLAAVSMSFQFMSATRIGFQNLKPLHLNIKSSLGNTSNQICIQYIPIF
jgi:hypothetical protein